MKKTMVITFLVLFVFGLTGSAGAVPFSEDKDFNALSKKGRTAAKFKNQSSINFSYDLGADISLTDASWTVSHLRNWFPKFNKKEVVLTTEGGDKFVLGTLGRSGRGWTDQTFGMSEQMLGLMDDGPFSIQIRSSKKKLGNIFFAGASLNGDYEKINPISLDISVEPPIVGSVEPICPGGDNTPAPVPEPATMLLFGAGLAGLAGLRKRIGKQHQ